MSSRLASARVTSSVRLVEHADEHGDGFSGWAHEFIQIAPGRFEGLAREINFRGLQVFHDVVNRQVRYRGGAWRRARVFISFLPNCGPVYYGNRGIPPQTVLSHRWDEAEHINLASEFQSVGICMDEDLVEELKSHNRHSRLRPHQPARRPELLGEGGGKRIQLVLLKLLDQVGSRPEILSNVISKGLIVDDLLDLVTSLVSSESESDHKPIASMRAYIAYTAQQYIEENLAMGLSMSELCSTLNVSRRALEYAFQDIIGTSPRRYILALRMARARRDMLSGDPDSSVSEIGERWGFFHLGRFGSVYKSYFGELPSQTARSARQRG